MPPRRYPRALEEKMAAIADQLAQLVDVISSSNTRLKAAIANMDKAMAKFLPTSAFTASHFETISKQLPIQTTTTTNPVITYTDIDNEVITTQTPLPPRPPSTINPTRKSSKIKQKMSISYRPSAYTTGAVPHIIATTNPLLLYLNPPKQTLALPLQQISPKDLQAIRCQELCIRCSMTFFPRLEFKPPKFVFLPSEHDPPWKRHNSGYKSMSLEDKARFKGGSIDTATTHAKSTRPVRVTRRPIRLEDLRNQDQVFRKTRPLSPFNSHAFSYPCFMHVVV